MKKYALVVSHRLEDFLDKCNALLASGAEPLGGVSTVDVRTHNSMSAKIQYVQAFMKEDKQ